MTKCGVFVAGSFAALTSITCQAIRDPIIVQSDPRYGSVGPSWTEIALDSASLTKTASVILVYDFQVVGSSSTAVPLTIDYFLNTSATGIGSNAKAELAVYRTTNFQTILLGVNAQSYYSSDGTYVQFKNGSGKANITATSVLAGQNLPYYSVSLTSAVGIAAGANHFASAYADPHISISPEFLAIHPEYYLVFSKGIVNAVAPGPSVPEPAPWILMLMGVAALQSMRRRRAGISLACA